MNSRVFNALKNRPLLWFYVLACAFSWAIEIPVALAVRGSIRTDVPLSLHYLAGYGPMLAAILMTRITAGKTGLKDLLRRMGKWRVQPVWWLVAFSPLGIYILAGIIQWSTLYSRLYQPGIKDMGYMLQWASMGLKGAVFHLGQIQFLPMLGLAALPLWVFTFGIGEETGWRGYALPLLQEGRSTLAASILLWGLWAFWHLPLFFYAYSASVLPGFLVGLLAGAITLTWLYNSTGGSVLIAAVWHGVFNQVTACMECKTGSAAALISAAVIVFALVLVVDYMWWKPRRMGKETVSAHQ